MIFGDYVHRFNIFLLYLITTFQSRGEDLKSFGFWFGLPPQYFFSMSTLSKQEQIDTEGLKVLRWSMFDSPDSPGSGYRFMEREPVVALDRAAHYHKFIPNVILGYTSKFVADSLSLVSDNSHRVGKAVRIRCVGSKKRLKLIRSLMEQGVQRFAVDRETVYFDTDDLKPPSFYLW